MLPAAALSLCWRCSAGVVAGQKPKRGIRQSAGSARPAAKAHEHQGRDQDTLAGRAGHQAAAPGTGWAGCGRPRVGVSAGVRASQRGGDGGGGGWRGGGWRITMPVVGGERGGAGLVVALLGPVEIGAAGGVMAGVPQPRLRVLLGLLAVAAGRVVGAQALVDGVWGEDWSPGREKNL